MKFFNRQGKAPEEGGLTERQVKWQFDTTENTFLLGVLIETCALNYEEFLTGSDTELFIHHKNPRNEVIVRLLESGFILKQENENTYKVTQQGLDAILNSTED